MAHGMYGLDDTQQKLAQAAASTAETLAKHADATDREGKFPRASLDAVAAAGLYGLGVPAALGGHGQAPRAFAAVVEELAMGCASTAMIYVMHVTAAQAVAASRTLRDRDRVLSDIAAGRHLTTLALSEKGSRSQFWAPVSKLEPQQGGGFVTNAFKSWVTSANHADSIVSSAQKPGAASPAESTIYLARKGAPGLRVSAGFDGLGLRGNDSAPVSIEGLALADGDLLSAQGAGAQMMLEVILPWFAVGTSAMANGICRAAVTATAGHLGATGFEHTGEKLRDLPQLRARVARMSVRTEQARALLAYTTSDMERPSAMTPLYVLESRLAALEAALEVTDLAMKACGGAAFSRHLPVDRLFRDARAGWVMAPTADHLLDFIGRALTGLPLF
jgi:alkylation response protein AidB-like acyl-CoA dehydrogenase